MPTLLSARSGQFGPVVTAGVPMSGLVGRRAFDFLLMRLLGLR
jgi:hypothetical protein